MKSEIMPLYSNVIIRPYEENPYLKNETESGLKLTNGKFDNPDSGQRDTKDFWVHVGEAIEVGPDCKYVKAGDDVMFDIRGVRPVPFMNSGFVVLAEQNLIAVLGENLKERLSNGNK